MSEHEETVYTPAWFCGVVVVIDMVLGYVSGRAHQEQPIPTPTPVVDLSQLATRSDVQACEAQMHKYMLRIDTALARSVVLPKP